MSCTSCAHTARSDAPATASVEVDGEATRPEGLEALLVEEYGAEPAFLARLAMLHSNTVFTETRGLDLRAHLSRVFGVDGLVAALDQTKVLAQAARKTADAARKLTTVPDEELAALAEVEARATELTQLAERERDEAEHGLAIAPRRGRGSPPVRPMEGRVRPLLRGGHRTGRGSRTAGGPRRLAGQHRPRARGGRDGDGGSARRRPAATSRARRTGPCSAGRTGRPRARRGGVPGVPAAAGGGRHRRCESRSRRRARRAGRRVALAGRRRAGPPAGRDSVAAEPLRQRARAGRRTNGTRPGARGALGVRGDRALRSDRRDGG